MTDELEGMWKEAVVSTSSGIYMDGLRNGRKHLSHDNKVTRSVFEQSTAGTRVKRITDAPISGVYPFI
jgi:hypothetical protein